jgi:hypothetical protein
MRYALVLVDSSLLDSGVPVTSLITGLLPWFDSCQKEKDPRYGERGRELNGRFYFNLLIWDYRMEDNKDWLPIGKLSSMEIFRHDAMYYQSLAKNSKGFTGIEHGHHE